MTKDELSKTIQNKTGIDKNTVKHIVDAALLAIKDSLADGEAVYLRGFGTFHIKHRATKPGRVISENRTIIIPARNTPAFKPARAFLKQVKTESMQQNNESSHS